MFKLKVLHLRTAVDPVAPKCVLQWLCHCWYKGMPLLMQMQRLLRIMRIACSRWHLISKSCKTAFTISCTDTAKSAKHFVFEPPFSWNKEKGSSVKALYWRRGIVLMHSTPPKGLIVRAIDTNEFIGFLKWHSLMQRYLQVPCTLRLIIFNHQNALAVLLFIKLEFRE